MLADRVWDGRPCCQTCNRHVGARSSEASSAHSSNRLPKGLPNGLACKEFCQYTRRQHLGRSRVPCLAVGVLSLAYERNGAVSGKSGAFLPTDEVARVVAAEENGTVRLNDAFVSWVHRGVTRDVNPRSKTVRDATPADAYGRL